NAALALTAILLRSARQNATNGMPMKFRATRAHGFTLIELIVVILVIVALAALLVPAASRTLDRAKSAQAKNDVTQIVTAVNAFYTEYGKYPIATQGSDATSTTNNSDVIYTLRAVASGANALDVLNPRKSFSCRRG